MTPNIINNKEGRQLSFKAAHITDMHFNDNIAVCVARTPVLSDKIKNHSIDYILNTGDTTNDGAPYANTWTAFKNNQTKPIISAKGNHDWYALDVYGIPGATGWYAQTINSKWKIIVLNSQGGGNYSLGATQLAWLQTELAATPTTQFVCIMSHVPFCGIAGMMWYLRNNQGWSNTVDYHSDSKQIIDIIKQYPNVKVCLSGHQHTIDKVEHEGVVYLCSGAVSANWWQDNSYLEKGYPAGYRLIDFYNDGTIREKFMTY